MSFNPSFAVVLEGGLVQAIVAQDWPTELPLPAFAVVDYNTEGAADDEITRVGDAETEAICRSEIPSVFETIPGALSPRSVLAALGEPVADDVAEPLTLARSVRQGILDRDAEITAAERSPTGDDYNDIYLQANHGLIDVLKALGDPSDFRR
ncbi:hypothetical protein [Achromobacter xylosoxidans]|uniref:hypothetical protein n=1 Tax=Alcaligenes xylosoxydans xylosoxydans TaxID=85698 RepID=UPI001EEE223B|nr:hypothetical protein [Achromobacter xylosoxidans]